MQLEINGVGIVRKKIYHYAIPFCRFQEKKHIIGINTRQSEHLNQLRTEEPVLANLFILSSPLSLPSAQVLWSAALSSF